MFMSSLDKTVLPFCYSGTYSLSRLAPLAHLMSTHLRTSSLPGLGVNTAGLTHVVGPETFSMMTEPIQANKVFKAILPFLIIDLTHVSWRCRMIFEVEGNAPGVAHAPVSTIDHRVDLVLSNHVIYQHTVSQVGKKTISFCLILTPSLNFEKL